MLTPQMNWKHPFDSYQLYKNSSYTEGSDDECALVELNLKLHVIVFHIRTLLDLVH
jgi:hypothetical protein